MTKINHFIETTEEHNEDMLEVLPPIGEAYNDEWTAYYEKLKQHILYTGRELTWMDNVEPMDKSC